MTDAARAKEKNPIIEYAQSLGWELRNRGVEKICLCPFHPDSSPSMRLHPEKQLWKCDPCDMGGDVIKLHAMLNNISMGTAIRELNGEEHKNYTSGYVIPKKDKKPLQSKPNAKEEALEVPLKEVKAYDYHDPTGKLLFQVVRYEPKTFRQRAILSDGSISWKMDGVERVPYNLPDVLSSPMIFIVEGEKDVETLRELNLTATCNPGGAKKWLPSYSQYLKGKKVFIIGDNDEPGQEHARQVLKSLEGLVEFAKWIELPKEREGKTIKDITDLKETFATPEEFFDFIIELEKNSRLIDRGVDCEIYSMKELEDRYKQEVNSYSETTLCLANWLPQLNLRPLIPGEVLGIIAGTGNLKTASMQNIVASNNHLSTLMFQLEVTETLIFERSAAISSGLDAEEVFHTYKKGKSVNWQRSEKFKNLFVCPRSNMSMQDIDEYIARSSAKIGKSPEVFVIDYLQLVRGKGNRYERISDAAEEAKVLAKKWKSIGIVISQIGRKKKDDDADTSVLVPTLQDAKESGSIENSVGLMLGVWKTAKNEMRCKVLKNTKGLAGQEVSMSIVGGTFAIVPK